MSIVGYRGFLIQTLLALDETIMLLGGTFSDDDGSGGVSVLSSDDVTQSRLIIAGVISELMARGAHYDNAKAKTKWGKAAPKASVLAGYYNLRGSVEWKPIDGGPAEHPESVRQIRADSGADTGPSERSTQ